MHIASSTAIFEHKQWKSALKYDCAKPSSNNSLSCVGISSKTVVNDVKRNPSVKRLIIGQTCILKLGTSTRTATQVAPASTLLSTSSSTHWAILGVAIPERRQDCTSSGNKRIMISSQIMVQSFGVTVKFILNELVLKLVYKRKRSKLNKITI